VDFLAQIPLQEVLALYPHRSRFLPKPPFKVTLYDLDSLLTRAIVGMWDGYNPDSAAARAERIWLWAKTDGAEGDAPVWGENFTSEVYCLLYKQRVLDRTTLTRNPKGLHYFIPIIAEAIISQIKNLTPAEKEWLCRLLCLYRLSVCEGNGEGHSSILSDAVQKTPPVGH